MNIKEDKRTYANVVSAEDSTGIGYDELNFLPCDYILRCVDGPYEGRQIRIRELGNEIIIGTKDSCNFNLNDTDVSETHCKLTYLENSFYYKLEDLKSESGTWVRISNLDDAFEVKERTVFSIFQNIFEIYEEMGTHILQFIKGPQKGTKTTLEEEANFFIGKKGASINLEMPCSENITYRILKYQGRVFVKNDTLEATNDGIFYCLHENEVALIKAGDIIKLGKCCFRIIVHNWGVFSEIGDRPNQEDKFCIIDDIRIFDDIAIPYYAVYDGHVGGSCSLYLQKHLHHNLRAIIKSRELDKKENFFVELCNAIQDVIIYTDLSYYESENISLHYGSTCVFLFFIGNKVLCCNLGDSICIYIRNDKKIYLSKDFKPSRPKEIGRITAKGGYITDQRLLGIISVTRGFGDWRFKDPKKQDQLRKLLTKQVDLKEYVISNRAEFRILEIDPEEDEYLMLCSDGIFQQTKDDSQIFGTIDKYLDVEKNNTPYSNVKNIPNVTDNVRLDVINNIYMDSTTKGNHADNMTLILVHLQNDKIK